MSNESFSEFTLSTNIQVLVNEIELDLLKITPNNKTQTHS